MTLIEHARWCIFNLPCTRAEETVFWFAMGCKPTDCPELWVPVP